MKDLEKTETVRIYNYPPDPNTYTYLTRIYRKDGIEVEGEPIYFHTLPFQTMTLARLYGEIQNALDKVLPR